jgi:PTH1 family peptidyl-tRNA hydrolase
MLLLAGLGNPGPEHANDRHNVGFMAVDEIVRRHSFSAPRRRFRGEVFEGSEAGEKILALKPHTYMNRSGDAVGEAVRFFKLEPEQVIVIYDELDLAPGKLRVKTGGGLAGHNGLRSINAHIGPDFRRVRIGIGHPGDKNLVANYVLHAIPKSDRALIDPIVEAIADAFAILLRGDDSGFMTRVALLTKPPEKPARDNARARRSESPDGA